MDPSPPSPETTHADAANPKELSRVVDFLNDVGIKATLTDQPLKGFLDGVIIKRGELEVGPNAPIDAVLHEAGHLATTPKPFRHWMNDNLARGQKKALDAVARIGLDPESALGRHVLQFSDTEATAWAYAAGKALGLDEETIIPDHAYEGEGAQIRAMCKAGKYFGVSGLVNAGMCDAGLAAKMRGNPAYPTMLRWVQDGPYPEWKEPHAEAREAPARKPKMGP